MADKLNPWLKERLEAAEKRGSPLKYIIEVAPGTRDSVLAQFRVLPGLSVLATPADRYISVMVPSTALLSRIEAIPEVVKISAETVYGIRGTGSLTGLPLRLPSVFDPWRGEVGISRVEIDVGLLEGLVKLPLRVAASFEETVYTTDQVRQLLGVPKDNKINTRVAVLDTGGIKFPHPLMHLNTKVYLKSLVPGELPIDGMSHGAWTQAAAFGDDFTHPRWGRCEGVADAYEQAHFKVLSNLGFGMLSFILDGIYKAYEWGAKLISMSLGGPLEGSAIEDDPICRLVNDLSAKGVIFVIAAGNEGRDWSIGSPGAAPSAITVGSWGITRNALAGFSSRGPSGEFYRDHPDVWERDLAIAGEDLRKPDLVCYGGDDLAKEKLLSAGMPWYSIFTDLVPGFSLMHGTSMSTPIVAGALAFLYDRGIIKSAKEAKDIMKRAWGKSKSSEVGYGLFHIRHFGT